MTFKCINCESDKFKIIANELRDSCNYKVVKCQNCGLVQLDKMPDVEDDQAFYDNDKQVKGIIPDFSISKLKSSAQSDIERRYANIRVLKEKCSNINTILEVGCGYGFFVEYLLTKDIDIEGIEISAERREIANSICQNKIFNTNLLMNSSEQLSTEKKEKKYDLICFFQVLEHISNPCLFLNQIKNKFMKESTLLMIEVPNINDGMLEISKDYFDFYWQRAHLTYYDKDTLEDILKKSGFEVVDSYGVQRYSIENAFNWIINNVPQLEKPSYRSIEKLDWLENFYKNEREKTLTSDTLMIIAKQT